MIFLGTTFFSGKHILNPTITAINDLDTISLKDGTYGHLLASTDPEMTALNIYDEWNFNTVLNAFFLENLDSGNSSFSLKTTDTILIRIREKGTHHWQIIKTIKPKTVDDFTFSFIYKYGRNQTWYEVSIVSVCNGIENSYVIKEIYSEFDGMYIMDQFDSYGTIYDVNGFDITRNINNEVIQLLHDKYATVYSSGNSNFETGSATGSFIKIENSKTLKIKEGSTLRNQVMDFLCNNKPKIIKIFDGRIWMVRITGTPTDQKNENPHIRQISFNWTEIGDVTNTKTMSRHGLLDVLPEWRKP